MLRNADHLAYDQAAEELECQIQFLEKMRREKNIVMFWSKSREVGALFKRAKISWATRQLLWARYEAVNRGVKSFQNEFALENLDKISFELTRLEMDHINPDSPLTEPQYHLGEFWNHADRVKKMLRNLFLPIEKLDSLWQRYHEICNAVKKYDHESRKCDVVSFYYLRDEIKRYGLIARNNPDKALQRLNCVTYKVRKAMSLSEKERSELFAMIRSTSENAERLKNKKVL